MADILHEEIFSSLNFRVQSCLRVGAVAPPPTPLHELVNWLLQYAMRQIDCKASDIGLLKKGHSLNAV